MAKIVESGERCRRCNSLQNPEFRFCPACGAPNFRPRARNEGPLEPILIFEEERAESAESEAVFA